MMENGKNAVVPLGVRQAPKDQPAEVVGKKFPSNYYVDTIARYPTLALVLSVLPCLVIMFIAVAQENSIDASTDGFGIKHHEVFHDSRKSRLLSEEWMDTYQQRNFSNIGPYSGSRRTKPKYRVEIQYKFDRARYIVDQKAAGTGANGLPGLRLDEKDMTMISEWGMSVARDIELDARESRNYQHLCFRNNFKGGVMNAELPPFCVPPVTLNTYLYPGLPENDVDWPWSGDGTHFQHPLEYTNNRIRTNANYKWFIGPGFTSNMDPVAIVRTQLVFGWPLAKQDGGDMNEVEYEGVLHTFINDFRSKIASRLKTIQESKSENSTGSWTRLAVDPRKYIDIVIGGDQVEEARLMDALEGEYFRVPIAAIIVVAFIYMHARSGIITCCAIVQLLLVYLVSTGLMSMNQHRIPLMSSVSLYVIITFGLDGTMVYYDTFIHSGVMPTTGRRNLLSVAQRMAYTMRKAGTGVVTANLVALGAFATNASSAIPAVADFGVLMILVCLVNIYMALTYAPSYILFHHYYFSKRRRNLQRQKEVLMRRGKDRKRHAVLHHMLQMIEKTKEEGELPFATLNSAEKQIGRLKKRKSEVNEFMDDAGKLIGEITGAMSAIGRSIDGKTNEANKGTVANAKDEENDFDMAAFADVQSSADFAGQHVKSSAAFVPPFTNARLISHGDIIHIPPGFCFRSQQTRDFIVELLGAIAAAQEDMAEPPTAVREQAKEDTPGLSNPSADSSPGHGLDNTMDADGDAGLLEHHEDVESVQLQSMSPDREGCAAPSKNKDDDDKDTPNTLVESLPNPDELDDEKLRAFMSKWGNIGDQLEVLPGDGKTAMLVPLLAHYVCCVHDSAYVVSHAQSELYYGRSKVNQQQATGFVAAPILPDPEETQSEIKTGCCSGVRNWWAARGKVKRKWCFGRFGKRVGESQEEKDARIMNKKIKHEGYGRLELFFLNVWAPFAHQIRFFLVSLTLVLIILFAVFASQVSHGPVDVKLIEDSRLEEFEQNRKMFQIDTKACDYCSAYYRDPKEFYLISPAALTVCRHQGYNLMHGWADDCGTCLGYNKCKDCAGIAFGNSTTNDCGACVDPSEGTTSCGTCYSPEVCGYCQFTRGTAFKDLYGPNCTVACNDLTCPPSRGSCHPYTGQCVCHHSAEKGYFTGDQCSSCVAGFSPQPDLFAPNLKSCHIECSAIEENQCGCGLDGRCRLCSKYSYGATCSDWTDACQNGGIKTPGGCACPTVFGDGARCQRHRSCSFNGELLSATTAPVEGCACRGNWVGPECQFCGCFNGGVCDGEGKCLCKGGWSGDRCDACPSTCQKHGYCPRSWPQKYYPMDTCTALFCPKADIDAGRVCAECMRQETPGNCEEYNNASWPQNLRKLRCEEDLNAHGCHWATTPSHPDGLCFSKSPAEAPSPLHTECACKGAWSGDHCDACAPPIPGAGLICLDDGRVEGCDGIAVDVREGATYAVPDRCGICKGDGSCVGCDGVQGSTKAVDQCGVCGGNNECLKNPNAKPKVYPTVTFTMGLVAKGDGVYEDDIDFDWNTAVTQQAAEDLCISLSKVPHLVSNVECPPFSFIGWSFTKGNGRHFQWPSDNKNATPLFFTFAQQTGRLPDIGFNSHYVEDPKLALKWLKIKAKSNLTDEATPSQLKAQREALRAHLDQNEALTNVIISNEDWVDGVSKELAIVGLRYSLGVGTAVAAALTAILTCSITLTLSAMSVIAVAVLFVLSVVEWSGWGIGPVEQICMSMLLGLASQHTIHMLEGYLDTVHGSQSHLFAREITTLSAVKGALVRSGVSVTISTAAVTLVSLLFIDSTVLVFRRAAQIIIAINLSSGFAALVLLAGVLAVFGPGQSYRRFLVSVLWAIVLGVIACGCIFIVFLAGGATNPKGEKTLN